MNGTTPWDIIWLNGTIACCESEQDSLLNNAALATKGGKIAWIGPVQQLPNSPEQLAREVINVSGKCITPGLIDCHTHFIFAGNRANEFELRLQGKTYEEIAQQGGGIKSTVKATRDASEEELVAQSLWRAKSLIQSGVTTLEVKSGYGLDLETEVKMLRAAKKIENMLPITIKTTFLGAHAVPIEYQGKSHDYINLVCNDMLPYIAQEKLASAVDVFCERIAFNLEQTEKVFSTAKNYNFDIKCHAEQLSCSGAASLAAKYGALSVDHLEHLSIEGVIDIAAAKTVAVLLPGAFYYLKETVLPPTDALRQHKIPIAIASDCNPGTSPILSLPLIMSMACTLFGLTPQEALQGVTRNAARALGIEATHGTLSVGKVADIAIWNVNHPRDLMYYLGGQPLASLVKNGEILAIDQPR